MHAQKPHHFKHTTLGHYPNAVAGITLLDEKPGFTGIYLRSPEGGLWPARTVNKRPAKHHEQVVASWLDRQGEHVDLRVNSADKAKLAKLRKLGVRWPKGRAIPTYPASMSEAAKAKADHIYDSMSEAFIDAHGSK